MSKRVYIGLSTPKNESILTKLIKMLLRTKYSHCYVRWETSWGFDAIYEASGVSVKFVGGDIWHKKNVIHKEWALDISLRTFHDKFLSHLMSISGTQYGVKQLVQLGIALMFRTKGGVTKDKKNTMICSELIYYVLTEVFEKKWDIDPDIVTPKDIERYLNGST
jgi:hypothetical protein